MSQPVQDPGTEDREIQVSGLENFPESRWREAILYYLDGVWANKERVMYRPKIVFGPIALRLDASKGEYFAYGSPSTDYPPPSLYLQRRLIVAEPRQADVETALIRFVKDNRIRVLDICLRGCELVLWKKSQRGQYGIAAMNLPSMSEAFGLLSVIAKS